ncbi:MAG: type II toxin-antitoxin system VapC family toxin [Gammaproteobacteria bacterium]
MRLLLDTQIALWWLTHAKQVPAKAREWVEQAEDGVFVSQATLWELAIKVNRGKLRLDLPKFARQIERDGFRWLRIDNRHLLTVAGLPSYDDHKDPFDRLLVAQSMTEPLILLSTNAKLSRYGTTVQIVEH